MSDIFISYARPNEGQARLVAELLRAQGYGVWRDDELPAHRAYSDVIEERIKEAKAVVVLWSADATRSQWVRAEADAAREGGTLVQISLDGSLPPMPFNQIQCADLAGWQGDAGARGWQKVMDSIATLAGAGSAPGPSTQAPVPDRKVVVCVVPFLNMSGDAEQEYFSDGISEDVIIDLSKVSALSLVARNVAFSLKGKPLDTAALVRDLGVTHMLEGSVRKAGDRVRITAQLIDCDDNLQLWGERYDRDLTDIFAIQDEISKAIVSALKLKLLPKEKKAIEQRGTTSPEAYSLYLLARQHWISGNKGDQRRDKVVVRICQQATTVDPSYARAWALMSLAQCELRFWHGIEDIDALTPAERAIELDPDIAEAYCVRARYLQIDGKLDEANNALETALRLEPESWEVNKEVAFLYFRQGRANEAIPYFEKATALMDTDFHDPSMLLTCYQAAGDTENAKRVAGIGAIRAEKAVASDPGNAAAMATGAYALAALGDGARAKEWISRALMFDPDNLSMRYNLGCAQAVFLGDKEGAIATLELFFENANPTQLQHSQVDPDMNFLKDDPRFEAMSEAALQRLGMASQR
ncbi:MAG: TIR domain-containing protein [Candidatus Andeanibacterium colombiense]|uniref:TIR domain-containing protein n=1 Tax=Candidatus Andeanibacterium colombiense TaxID=3121345 RepID=A0AAJ5X720_9SPHN|nr:MAG: TIR domain-containing protein [Sphingomonadaceae bacterium]